jgi:hypothetical protein
VLEDVVAAVVDQAARLTSSGHVPNEADTRVVARLGDAHR